MMRPQGLTGLSFNERALRCDDITGIADGVDTGTKTHALLEWWV